MQYRFVVLEADGAEHFPLHGRRRIQQCECLVAVTGEKYGVVPLAAVPVGTVALYSDGKVEKLVSAGEEGLRWEDDRKRQYLRSRNPAVPVLERRDFLSGRGYRQIVSSGNPDALLELPVELRVDREPLGVLGQPREHPVERAAIDARRDVREHAERAGRLRHGDRHGVRARARAGPAGWAA